MLSQHNSKRTKKGIAGGFGCEEDGRLKKGEERKESSKSTLRLFPGQSSGFAFNPRAGGGT